jgi:SAM-dependent methyltransferase
MFNAEICPSCGSKHLKKIKDHNFSYPGPNVQENVTDMVYVRLWILFTDIIKDRKSATFSSMQCETCGLIFTNPRFSEGDMTAKYTRLAEFAQTKKLLEVDPLVDIEERAEKVYKLCSKFASGGNDRRPKVLDYGGAAGYILKPFLNRFDCGILDYERWELPEGVKYLGRDLSDLQQTDKFDVILLLHTLEHAVHPGRLVQQLSKHLSDDGILYVEVPLGCFKEWSYISEPLTHIDFFSEESLFHCFNGAELRVLHASSAYQRVARAKMWCINMVGTKNAVVPALSLKDTKSTANQMNNLSYYVPYVFNSRAIKGVARKLLRT